MDSSSNLRARAFVLLKMLENGAKRRRMQTVLKATLLLATHKWYIDHDCNLIALLERFEQHHVKLNINKMKLFVRKATFMGQVIDITTDGRQPNPVMVSALIAMPTPIDKHAVCRFLGAINGQTLPPT